MVVGDGVGAAVVGAAVVGTMVVGDGVGAAVVGAAVVGAAVFGDTSLPPFSSTMLLIQSYTLLTRAKTRGNPLAHSFPKEVIPTTTSSSAFTPLLIKGPPSSPVQVSLFGVSVHNILLVISRE